LLRGRATTEIDSPHLFLGFIRVMPSLSIVEVKEVLPHPLKHGAHH
jgi:hypothetical protein